MADQDRQNRIIDGLSRLMVYQKSLMKAESSDAFFFELVNNSRTILNFQHCIALEIIDGSVDVKAVSAVPTFDKRSPLADDLRAFVKALPAASKDITLTHITQEMGNSAGGELKRWANMDGFYLTQSHGDYVVALLIFYGDKGTGGEDNLATELFDHASIIWDKIKRPQMGIIERATNSRKKKLAILGLILLVLLFPMRTSVTADAAIAAKDAAYIRSGLKGVVEEIHVDNNADVKSGDLLVSFDKQELTNMLAVSERELKTTQAELNRVSQLAITNREQREQLQILTQTVETKKAEVALYEDRLSRISVTASQDGIAIIGDENLLIGRPVNIGETLLMIADPNEVELEIFIAVEDAILMDEGSAVKMFLNIAPQTPLEAILTSVSYRAEVTAEGYLAFKAKATLAEGEDVPRIGLRGTARIYGSRAPLIVQVLRKPLAALRQWMGL